MSTGSFLAYMRTPLRRSEPGWPDRCPQRSHSSGSGGKPGSHRSNPIQILVNPAGSRRRRDSILGGHAGEFSRPRDRARRPELRPVVAGLAGTLAGRARTRSTRLRQFGGLVVERSLCRRARAVGPSGCRGDRGPPAGRAQLFLPAALRRATAPLGDQELFSDRAARWDERGPVSGR
jgi:hypothetical protein